MPRKTTRHSVGGAADDSLRDIGYDLPSAVADLVDNSIDAGATVVEIGVCRKGERLVHPGRRRRSWDDRARARRGDAVRQSTLV